MKERETVPETAFIDPRGRNRDAVAALAHAFLDRVLAHLATAADRPPLPAAPVPAGQREPLAIPEEPCAAPRLLAELDRLFAGAMNPASPGWIGHMDPLPATLSILGDLAAAALNNNMLSVEMSPGLSALESGLLRGFAALFGLPEGAGGVLASGGSLANLHALVVARNERAGARPVVLASEVAHTSLQKAAMVAGLGAAAVLPVRADGESCLAVDDLRVQLRAARDRGEQPFCVVATAGTTVTGSIDPLREIAAVARAEGLWLHVDAAYGGALVFADWRRHLLDGIAEADSITFNPQKWLYVAKTCAMALYRDAAVLDRSFRIAAPYMGAGGGTVNLGEIGVQGTRHADVVKLWLALTHLGRRGYEALIEGAFARTRRMTEEIEARPFLRLAGPPQTNLVCFRGAPEGEEDGDAADAWTAGLQRHLLQEAGIFLSLPRYRGRSWLRAVLLNPYTDDAVLERLFAAVDAYAGR